jgi:hypothetical protein
MIINNGKKKKKKKKKKKETPLPVVGMMKEVAVVVLKMRLTSSRTDLESVGMAGER